MRTYFLLICISLSLNANAEFEFLTKVGFVELAKKEIAKQSVNVDLNIFDLPIADGLTEALHMKMRSEPSYVNGYYTRLDQINLSTNADILNLADLTSLPFGFNMSRNAEVIFARQFKSQRDSITALPYTLWKNFPINAEKAINNLNVGDFVSFHATLNFVISKAFFGYYNLGAYASSSGYAMISGDFLINLFKIDNNKIRIKFIANRGKGAGVSAGAGFASPLKFIGFNFVDGRINDWINLSIGANAGKSDSDIFLVDFTFDLSDPKAAIAFTNLMSRKAMFKDLSILNPLHSPETLAKKLMTDMSEVEAIFNEDRNLPANKRRIDRLFKGSNSAEIKSSNFALGFKLLNFSANKSFVRNRISNIDKTDVKQNYLFDVYSKSHKYGAFFGAFGGEEITSTNMLLTADDDWTPKKFVALAMSRELRMINFSKRDLTKIKSSVEQLLPKEVYEKIDWKDWRFPDGKDILNGSFKNTLFFHQDSLDQIPNYDAKTLKKMFTEYLEKKAQPNCSPQFKVDDDTLQFSTSWVDQFENDINEISKTLAINFSKEASSQERYEAFLHSKDFPIFLERGAGFLISLLPKDRAHELIGYELTLSAKDVESVSFKFGKMEQEDLYRSLLYIQSIINNRSFDLRLYMDENGEFKPN